jgi:hypothetical protein
MKGRQTAETVRQILLLAQTGNSSATAGKYGAWPPPSPDTAPEETVPWPNNSPRASSATEKRDLIHGSWPTRSYIPNTSDVFSEVTMKNGVIWDVTPCGPCKNRHFGGT